MHTWFVQAHVFCSTDLEAGEQLVGVGSVLPLWGWEVECRHFCQLSHVTRLLAPIISVFDACLLSVPGQRALVPQCCGLLAVSQSYEHNGKEGA